ncbi:hypothetical protein MKX07_004775 [Trichoderma sp. CBMAI-0711]|nr:hypothetical protein MKX07_004775 [Trichoderma sp. CBMAI-0711]
MSFAYGSSLFSSCATATAPAPVVAVWTGSSGMVTASTGAEVGAGAGQGAGLGVALLNFLNSASSPPRLSASLLNDVIAVEDGGDRATILGMTDATGTSGSQGDGAATRLAMASRGTAADMPRPAEMPASASAPKPGV